MREELEIWERGKIEPGESSPTFIVPEFAECHGCGKRVRIDSPIYKSYPGSRRWEQIPPGWFVDSGLNDQCQLACSVECIKNIFGDET